ncbi:hypothetical protein V8E36_003557 [Tilletia maclaganii]
MTFPTQQTQPDDAGFTPIFAGQGAAGLDIPLSKIAPPSSLAEVCLKELHTTVLDCFKQLHPSQLDQLQLSIDDFKRPEILLGLGSKANTTPALSSSALLASLRTTAFQLILYLSKVEIAQVSFEDHLGPAARTVGVLGFSSGLIAATVVASSRTTLDYLTNSAAAIKVAFWLGVHADLFAKNAVAAASSPSSPDASWSTVVLNADEASLRHELDAFKRDHTLPPRITASLGTDSFTVSGRPDLLAEFQKDVVQHGWNFFTPTVLSLYHGGNDTKAVHEAIVSDLKANNVIFPALNTLKLPICSTRDVSPLQTGGDDEGGAGDFLEQLISLIVIDPTDWAGISARLANLAEVRLLNVGPGSGLFRPLASSIPGDHVDGLSYIQDNAIRASVHHDRPSPIDIAITGMNFKLPGAKDLETFWHNLTNGLNMCSPIPASRFDVNSFPCKSGNSAMAASTGNFIEAPDSFDNAFFNISSREAKSMDPQQRLLLQAAWLALEDAGYVPNISPSFNPTTMGVYVGVATNDYERNLSDAIDVYYSTGTLRAFLSGRISHALKLSGPSIVVDTACSGSLTAFHLACQAIVTGECTSAVAGGVNVVSSPEMFVGLDRAHFLSPTGQCKPWDAGADGYSRAEGVGCFVLKPLHAALKENDSIYGVIRATGLNQSGNSKSITQPHAETQAVLMRSLLAKSGIEKEHISYVEAHGTGTQTGDPLEMTSIRSVLGGRDLANKLHIGSVKAVVGHAEAGSGSAGLAKILAMMHHKTIPMQPLLKKLNPKVEPLEVDGCHIPLENVPWKLGPGQPSRIALLNNFGAAGANGALLVSEAPTPSRTILQSRTTKRNSWILSISAKTETALGDARQNLVDTLKKRPDISIGDLSYTLMARRTHYAHRITITAENKEDAITKLQGARTQKVGSIDFRCLALFSGQGSQHQGMGRELLHIPAFAATVQRCKAILKSHGVKANLSWLAAEQPETDSSADGLVDAIVDMQCSIFVLDLALYWLVRQLGVEAQILAGHSLGEYVALTVAGVLSLEDALYLVAERARLMATLCPRASTSMIAVNLGVEELGKVLASNPSWGLSVACINSRTDTVLSGPIKSLHALKSLLDGTTKARSTVLEVPFGYHSKAMAPIKKDFLSAGSKVQFNAPSQPVISNVLGRVVQPGEEGIFSIDYLYRHIEESVKFCSGLEDAFARLFPTVCLDFGAHPACLPMATAVVASSNQSSHQSGSSLKPAFLPTLKKKLGSWQSLLPTLETLHNSGVDIKWAGIFAGEQVRCLNRLPSYPFADTRYWVDYVPKTTSAQAKDTAVVANSNVNRTGYIMLNECVELPKTRDGGQAIFTTPAEQLEVFISGHSVGGQPLCPASVYHEFALAAVQYTTENAECAKVFGQKVFKLSRVEYQRPFVLSEASRENTFKIILTFSTSGDHFAAFEVHSQASGAKNSTCHCKGVIGEKDAVKMTSGLQRNSRFMIEQLRSLHNGDSGVETFKTKTIYERIFPRVVRYSEPYWSITSMSMSASGKEAVAHVKLPVKDLSAKGKFVVEPRFMDTILHATGFLINSQAPDDTAYICSKTDKVKMVYGDDSKGGVQTLKENDECLIFCVIESLPDEGVELGTAYVEQAGRIVATLSGMHFKAIPLQRLHMLLGAGHSSTPRPSVAHVTPVAMEPKTTHQAIKTSLKKSIDPLAADPNDVADRLRQLISETCGTPVAEVQDSVETASLGIDSLMVIELVAKVGQEWPAVKLDFTDFLDARVSDIVRLVTEQLPQVEEVSAPRPRLDSLPSQRSVSFKQALDAFSIKTEAVEDRLRSLISDTCGAPLDQIQNSTEAAALGIDSLMVIELVAKISEAWPAVHLDFTDFLDACVGDIIDLVKAQLSPEVDTVSDSEPDDVFSESESSNDIDTPLETPCETPRRSVSSVNLQKIHEESSSISTTEVAEPVLIQRAPAGKTSEPPLFLIHDGSGCWAPYTRLGSLQREVWGFSNPRSEPWAKGLPEMAACYAQQMRKLSAGKPLIVGGWSFGGVVAFEAARQLRAEGQDVKACVMIDSPYPIGHQGLSNSVIQAIAPAPAAGSKPGRIEFQKQFEMNTRALVDYGLSLDDSEPLVSGLQIVYLRSEQGFDCSISWLRDRADSAVANVEDWRPLVGPSAKLSQVSIPGNHFEAFSSANAVHVTNQLRQACLSLS